MTRTFIFSDPPPLFAIGQPVLDHILLDDAVNAIGLDQYSGVSDPRDGRGDARRDDGVVRGRQDAQKPERLARLTAAQRYVP